MAGSPKVSHRQQARAQKRQAQLWQAKRQLHAERQERRKKDNVMAGIAAAAVLALAVTLQLTAFNTDPSSEDVDKASSDLSSSPSSSDSSSPSPSSSLPPVPDASVAQGKTLTGTLKLNDKPLEVQLDGTKAPKAASVLKVLAESGYYSDKPCHRLTTGDFAVLQCGALDLNGTSAPNFTWGPIENAPENNVYPAGTIAIARVGGDANSNGTQFFITYKDTTIPADGAGGYSVVGKVTGGLEAISEFAKAGVQPGGSSPNDGKPVTAITVDSFVLS